MGLFLQTSHTLGALQSRKGLIRETTAPWNYHHHTALMKQGAEWEEMNAIWNPSVSVVQGVVEGGKV